MLNKYVIPEATRVRDFNELEQKVEPMPAESFAVKKAANEATSVLSKRKSFIAISHRRVNEIGEKLTNSMQGLFQESFTAYGCSNLVNRC